jgi:hypothetical protein
MRARITLLVFASVIVSITNAQSPPLSQLDPTRAMDEPHGAGHGPKSAFRYARIRFLAGGPMLRFRAIHLEDIYYPVHDLGSFESSDLLLNRIWKTAAYTGHLCMQDDIRDAPRGARAFAPCSRVRRPESQA